MQTQTPTRTRIRRDRHAKVKVVFTRNPMLIATFSCSELVGGLLLCVCVSYAFDQLNSWQFEPCYAALRPPYSRIAAETTQLALSLDLFRPNTEGEQPQSAKVDASCGITMQETCKRCAHIQTYIHISCEFKWWQAIEYLPQSNVERIQLKLKSQAGNHRRSNKLPDSLV